MFKEAIKKNINWTKPIYFASRYFKSSEVIPSIATMIILNNEGWALTCKHVVDKWMYGNNINSNYLKYKDELNSDKEEKLKKKYKYTKDSIVEQVSLFVSVFDGGEIEKVIIHNNLDLALIKWRDFTSVKLDEFPVFTDKDIIPGESVCRLGFPFPEYDCFKYSEEMDHIVLNTSGRFESPIFPLDGMITRIIATPTGPFAFETSTPGLKGQSGGPVFNTEGKILGIQSATAHLDLMFDINSVVSRGNKKEEVNEKQFLNVGICIDSKQIMKFLEDNNIKYFKED